VCETTAKPPEGHSIPMDILTLWTTSKWTSRFLSKNRNTLINS